MVLVQVTAAQEEGQAIWGDLRERVSTKEPEGGKAGQDPQFRRRGNTSILEDWESQEKHLWLCWNWYYNTDNFFRVPIFCFLWGTVLALGPEGLHRPEEKFCQEQRHYDCLPRSGFDYELSQWLWNGIFSAWIQEGYMYPEWCLMSYLSSCSIQQTDIINTYKLKFFLMFSSNQCRYYQINCLKNPHHEENENMSNYLSTM